MTAVADAEVLDYETAGRPSLSVVSTSLLLRRGDHLHWRHRAAWRDGILLKTVQLDKDRASVTLIRYCQSGIRMVVRKEVDVLDFRVDIVKRYEYGQYCHPVSVVVQRAQACIGYSGYNAIRNNNQDFCSWCKSGKHAYMLRNEFQLAGLVDKDDSEMTDWVPVSSWEQTVYGDHIAWRPLDSLGVWRHGVLMELSGPSAVLMTSDGERCAMVSLNLEDSRLDLNRVLYRKCHALNCVIQRAKEFCGSDLPLEDSYTFARWCKTGVPSNSRMTKIVLQTNTASQGSHFGANVAETSSLAGTTSVTRGVASAVVQQTGTAAALVAVEGAAAAAAVGVEAVVVGIEVGLTYKSFQRNEISRDELNKRNIVTVSRSTGAAGCSILGGVAGAAIGSAVPVVGTVIGGVVGGIVGGITGHVAGHFSGKGIAYIASRPYEFLFAKTHLAKVAT